MKYIKTFETRERLIYWLIPTKDPDYQIALDRINASPISWLRDLTERNYPRQQHDKIYITDKGDGNFQGWSATEKEIKESGLDIKFMGEVVIEPFERDAYFYNL